MATATKIELTTSQRPEQYREPLSREATQLTSQFLQQNHDDYHIFFNNDGFHNHIAHHLLTVWALRGSAEDLRQAYGDNKTYQRPQMKPDESIIDRLQDEAFFATYLEPEEHYSTFLLFFQREIEKTSWQQVLQKYLLAGDKRANDLLARTYAGFLHPIIHLGFGIEFGQPAIIAEALAQAACHDAWIADYFLPAEEAARKVTDVDNLPSIVQLLDDIRADKQIYEAPRWSDGNKIRDGIMKRAGDRMLSYAAKVRVKPEALAEKTAEMTNAAAYYTAGAQKSNKAIKYDFFFIHELNCSIFFSAFLKQDWLSDADKARLLEWKIRADLIMYASRKSPEIRMQDIRDYKPKQPSGFDEIEDRVCRLPDDGHASKLVRAIAHGQSISQPYEDRDNFRLKHDDWLQLAHMAIDSVEMPGATWVRSAGFDEAWKDVPARAQL
ncbi:uncharacterized protein K489DRAFT_316886 [Dissoconium aciculare CBS 342.82]|uniref:HypA-like protein n=1 Tax=Dissoconium aciculare CBS 342.82 TaxID=1314786 RepID=A0A6J3M7N7_9PEZI|nr:uncharacterized protein K489DRAFT_316886 [Dissoconium aciculare CBS 342.82]KAF1824015.1 hypothetical protein K489DRAFT_316886 [Dissoconium aciculare CBS 342.82]